MSVCRLTNVWIAVFLLSVAYVAWISIPKFVVFKSPSIDQIFDPRSHPSLLGEVRVDQTPAKVVILQYNDSLPVRDDPFAYKTFADIEEVFYRYFLWYTDALCPHMIRVGYLHDGGWDVCVSPPYAPTPGECTVLSFGINNDFSFDDEINNKFNCTVHSFDPSMKTKTYKRRDRMWFHDTGLAAANGTTSQGWKMMSYKETLEYLHLLTTVIDILKFDIEESEWEVLESMYKDGSLANVKQMMFEIHIFKRDATEESLKAVVNTLKYLHTIGFRRYYVNGNAWCVTSSQNADYIKVPNFRRVHPHVSCMEVYYINTKFIG